MQTLTHLTHLLDAQNRAYMARIYTARARECREHAQALPHNSGARADWHRLEHEALEIARKCEADANNPGIAVDSN